MPFARPVIFCSKDFAKFKNPALNNTSLMKIFEFGLKLHSATPDALIQLPDIQSPLDIAALIWEKSDFFMAMYDEPEAVKDLISMVYALLTEFLDLWFKTFGQSFISHYPFYYMPRGITLSEDEIGSISAELFREFSWPGLRDLSARYGNMIGIHCCANAKHQWELLKAVPGLVLLNLGQPDTIIREASVYFRDGPPLWASPNQNKCHDFRSRAVLTADAETKEDALDTLNQLREYAELFKIDGKS
jgi:uroporphyrinogen-III decarboxylase